MATGSIEMQSMECPVCHEHYHEPKLLPCAHLLCRSCLVSWMKKKTDALCPLCRSAILEREDVSSGNCEDIVDSLLTDHAMSALVESVKILNEKRVCHVHRGVSATSLCLYCNLKLCQSCVEVHKSLPVISFHKVEDLGTITLESLASNRQEPCSDHHDKSSELFCTAHNVLICQLCATSKHRTCPEVTCLKEVNEKYKHTLSDIKVKLTTTLSGLNRAITQIEEHLAASEKNSQAAFKQIDATCNTLLNSVETCRKRLKKLVQDADDKIKVTTLETKSSLDKRRGILTSHINLIERLQNTAHGSSLVAMVPKLENRIAKFDLDAPVPTRTGQGFQMVRLTIDRQTVVNVEQALEKIGELSLSPAYLRRDARMPLINLQVSPDPNLGSFCTVSIPCELLKGGDEACLKNPLFSSSDVHISKQSNNIFLLVKFDSLVKTVSAVYEQITNLTVVKKSENKSQNQISNLTAVKKSEKISQNQITHGTFTTEISSLEYEAMNQLMSQELKQDFRKVNEIGEKVTITFGSQDKMEMFTEKYNLIRKEEITLTQDEVVCLEKSTDSSLEDVEAFAKLLPLESKVVIICFDYTAMTKAKYLVNVKTGRQKVTQRNKRRFEGRTKESEMDDHQASLSATGHTDPNSVHSYVKDFNTKSGIIVSVYKADITQLTVDAIVNAANGDLQHSAGVAAAIAFAAGPELELEGDEYVKANGQLKVTQVIATEAGKLPCRKVLHAVGPRWIDYTDKEECQHDLEKTVFNSLEKAHILKFSSLALSSISSCGLIMLFITF